MLNHGKKLLFITVLGLAFGASISAMQSQDQDYKNALGDSLISMAYKNGDIERYKQMINDGANINYQDRNEGFTPLILAALYGRLDMVKELIARGADLDIKNEKGHTALILAAIYGRDAVVDALIQAGSNIFIHDQHGFTALMEVAQSHNGSLESRINIAKSILDAAILSAQERNAIKGWLLVNQRLGLLPKDPRTLVAQAIYKIPSGNDLRQRVLQAVGGEVSLKHAIRRAREKNLPIAQLLQQYSDPAFLEQRLRRMLPPMLRQRNQ